MKLSGKRKIISPDNTRKIIFQCDFFGKTIFPEHLEKENMVFRRVYRNQSIVFLCKSIDQFLYDENFGV